MLLHILVIIFVNSWISVTKSLTCCTFKSDVCKKTSDFKLKTDRWDEITTIYLSFICAGRPLWFIIVCLGFWLFCPLCDADKMCVFLTWSTVKGALCSSGEYIQMQNINIAQHWQVITQTQNSHLFCNWMSNLLSEENEVPRMLFEEKGGRVRHI